MDQKPEVFISYHTSTASDIVQQVSSALENAGIPCWYAPRNVVGDYATSIVEGIRGCKVFLLVLNAGADRSEDVRNEINCAFERFRKHEDIALLPFKVDACSLSDAVLYYLGRIHIMDGGLPPELLRTQELIDRISHLLNKKQERALYVINEEPSCIPQEEPEQKLYKLIGSTINKDSAFVGRTKELAQMQELLTQAPHKLILSGMGGIGKSELVNAYCSSHRQDYDVILWITYDTSLEKTLANDFRFLIQGMERRDYPQDSDAAYFRRKLSMLNQISDHRVLMILDNFDTEDDPDLEELARANCSMILTSRSRGLSSHIPEMEITGITEEADLLELFGKCYKRTLSPADRTDVKQLLQHLAGHPLSIRQYASAMAAIRITPKKMLLALQEPAGQLPSGKLADTIYTNLHHVFSLAALTEEELFVLKNLALMPLQGVDVAEFYQWCDLDDFEIIDGLIRKSWVIHDEAADQVHLHPLICDLMTQQLRADPDCCNRLLTSLIELSNNIDSYPAQYKRLFHNCFASIVAHLPANHPRMEEIRYGNAVMVMYQSRYDEAIPLMQQLRGQTESLFLKLDLSQRIAQAFGLCGKPQEAIQEAQIGLAQVQDLPLHALTTDQRMQVLNLHTRLSEAYRSLNELDKAEQAIRMVLKILRESPEPVDTKTLGWRTLFLARVLSMKHTEADLVESDRQFQQAEIYFQSSEDVSAVGYNHLFWGQLKMRQGDFDTAFSHTQTAYEKILETMGECHVDIAKIRLFEGNIWRAMGDEPNALRCYNQAIDGMVERKNLTLAEKAAQVRDSGKIGYTN